jgi:hypothetical protein
MLRDGGLDRGVIRGEVTGLVYVTAAAWGASNRTFVAAGTAGSRRAGAAPPEVAAAAPAGALYFPYTAPSAVPAEVAIEFELTGAYAILVGGAAAAIDALWQAGVLLARGRCDRVLVLAVETFVESADLWARARWLVRRPLVEAAVCALLVPGEGAGRYREGGPPSPLEALAARRAGETLAAAPLIALALARERGERDVLLSGEWRGRRAALELGAWRSDRPGMGPLRASGPIERRLRAPAPGARRGIGGAAGPPWTERWNARK